MTFDLKGRSINPVIGPTTIDDLGGQVEAQTSVQALTYTIVYVLRW